MQMLWASMLHPHPSLISISTVFGGAWKTWGNILAYFSPLGNEMCINQCFYELMQLLRTDFIDEYLCWRDNLCYHHCYSWPSALWIAHREYASEFSKCSLTSPQLPFAMHTHVFVVEDWHKKWRKETRQRTNGRISEMIKTKEDLSFHICWFLKL